MFDKELNTQEEDDDSLDGTSQIADKFDYFGLKVNKTYEELGGQSWRDLYKKESDPEKLFQYLSKCIDEPEIVEIPDLEDVFN